jgi:myo-inositol-1(or 4)-monophosphatase
VDASYVEALVRSTQGLRRTGSAAAELAMVAAGRFDVYVEHQLDVWDTTAGTLLVEEAGGKVTKIEAIDGVTGEIVVASNAHIHDEFINFVISEGSLG